jgi:hypothetical protein
MCELTESCIDFRHRLLTMHLRSLSLSLALSLARSLCLSLSLCPGGMCVRLPWRVTHTHTERERERERRTHTRARTHAGGRRRSSAGVDISGACSHRRQGNSTAVTLDGAAEDNGKMGREASSWARLQGPHFRLSQRHTHTHSLSLSLSHTHTLTRAHTQVVYISAFLF